MYIFYYNAHTIWNASILWVGWCVHVAIFVRTKNSNFFFSSCLFVCTLILFENKEEERKKLYPKTERFRKE